jgi:putative sterol carrier protein
MANPEEIRNVLNQWVKKMENPKVAEKFENFDKTMQLVFPDIQYNLKLIFKNKTLSLEEGFDEEADMKTEVYSDIWVGVLNKTIDPMEAFMRGDLKVDGDMKAMQKLELLSQTD